MIAILDAFAIVNVQKAKVMFVEALKEVKPLILYDNEAVELVDSFKQLKIEVGS